MASSSARMAVQMADEEFRAVKAVYGDDCHVITQYPLHLRVRVKPRTAEFVEATIQATIQISAGPKYPEEPPQISIVDSKGLDEQMQAHLLCSIGGKASELVSSSMVVALCEEAVATLSRLNDLQGDCQFCFGPLLASSNSSPVLKLKSCLHCFHCGCFISWLKENKSSSSSSSRITQPQQGVGKTMEENMEKCPKCHKSFLPSDMEHVPKLVATGSHLSDGRADTEATEAEDDTVVVEAEEGLAVEVEP